MENIFDLISYRLQNSSSREAFVIENEAFTYSQFKEKVDQVSGLLESLQLSPQEVVGVVTNDDKDKTHLNTKGATRFTELLVEELNRKALLFNN